MRFAFALTVAVLACVAATAMALCQPCNPCTPVITNQTHFDPVPGLRATVEIIPDYGSCGVQYRGYKWEVTWGDGVTSMANSSILMPVQALYAYKAGGTYNITASYCAYPFVCCQSCSSMSKVVTISS